MKENRKYHTVCIETIFNTKGCIVEFTDVIKDVSNLILDGIEDYMMEKYSLYADQYDVAMKQNINNNWYLCYTPYPEHEDNAENTIVLNSKFTAILNSLIVEYIKDNDITVYDEYWWLVKELTKVMVEGELVPPVQGE
jgi:hypothetical protein